MPPTLVFKLASPSGCVPDSAGPRADDPQAEASHSAPVDSSLAQAPAPGEVELATRLRQGEEAAFTEIYRAHHAPLYRFALQMGAPNGLAEELVHDVFVELMRSPQGFRPGRGSLRSYLFGVARHRLVDQWRRGRREVSWEEPGTLAGEPPSPDNVSEELSRRQELAQLSRALAALPWEYREVVVLCDLQEMPYQEAARILRCRTGTIASRRHRAHKLLQERLQRNRRGKES